MKVCIGDVLLIEPAGRFVIPKELTIKLTPWLDLP
jgi:hypothetical protein